MGDLMRPLPFDALMTWALEESRAHGSVLGLGAEHVFRPAAGRTVRDPMGHAIATPIGPAAGPHTQLAANIVASYLAGARFIELKTVQVMDGEAIRAAVAKPCINAQDEGFNCEWSTELTVGQAFDEYVRAHLAIRVLAVELGLGDGDDVAYNASVGYDLAGICSPLIDGFIEGLRDASATPVYRDALAWLGANLDRFERFGRAELDRLTPHVTDSVTLSTLHGCPAGEIERIATHLLGKGLHTFVKANPTMLGYDAARGILDSLGYSHITFDDHHFRGDLQFDDAVPMFRRLSERAAAAGLVFGVKLSNTLPNDVTRAELPAGEMYMSGRGLAPLTLALAAKLSHAFDGRLPISYSGGADATNIAEILATGIAPVTVATTLLKPGGYARLAQLAHLATGVMRDADGIDVTALDALVARTLADERVHKRHREKVGSRKTASALPLTDCYKAPCEHGGCPIEQQIPEYLTLVAQERYAEAFAVIARDNTAPTITGVLCSQPCREHCTRLDYDSAIDIRGVKFAAAEAAQERFIAATTPVELASAARVAVIGAGPAGIAAALFLRRNGVAVEVFEKADGPYGIVARIIPAFRITAGQIDRDFRLAAAAGVVFHFGCDPAYDLAALRTRFDRVIVATGSWGRGVTPVREGGEHVVDALDFLSAAHGGPAAGDGDAPAGRRIAVVGAGDVAMDCARTARRLPGVEHVAVVYRRTEPFMPAAQEDVNHVRAEGIEILELLAPLSYDGATLRCERTELGAYDAAGRRSTSGTGEFVDLPFDTVIGATGATLDAGPYRTNGITTDERGRPRLGPDHEAEVDGGLAGVHVIGDGRLGPDTVVRAVADAKVVARAILATQGIRADFDRSPAAVFTPEQVIAGRRGVLRDPLAPPAEGERCLRCDQVCEICTEVCPNRANVAVTVPGFADPRQIVHLDGLCNECGNCATFCPHAGAPYRDKVTVFWTREDFDASTNTGFLALPHADGSDDAAHLVRLPSGGVAADGSDDAAHLVRLPSGGVAADGGAYMVRLPSGEVVTHRRGADDLPDDLARILAALETEHPWYLLNIDSMAGHAVEGELEGAAP